MTQIHEKQKLLHWGYGRTKVSDKKIMHRVNTPYCCFYFHEPEISNCLEQNYLNRLLESTQTLAQHSEEIRLNEASIQSAISSIGLKKKAIDLLLDDSSDDSNSASTSTRFSNHASSSTSSNCDPTGLETIAIRTAINTFGLKKWKSGVGLLKSSCKFDNF